MTGKMTEKQKLLSWFVNFRWAAVIVTFIICLILLYPSRFKLDFGPILLLALVVCSYNLLFSVLGRAFIRFSEDPSLSFLRSMADLFSITAIIHYTGGVDSPLKILYLLNVAAISVAGQSQIAYLLSFNAATFYFLVCFLEAYNFIPHVQLTALPGALYLDLPFAFSKALALFFTSVLLVYIISYLTQRLGEKQAEIVELSDSKLDFVNTVMHEAKSPLTSIMGYTEILAGESLGQLAPQQKEPLNVIKRQSQRILSMVNDLLSLARLESGHTKLEKKPVVMAELFGHVTEELGPTLSAKKIKLVQEFDQKTPPVSVDEDKILEVLTNLLTNAIKFSNENGRIFLTLTPQGKEILVAVRDEGIGIKSIDLPHIFEKFYRAGKESAERKGTGLGLALSRAIVEMHGGRLWAVSAGPDQGAVFYFTLPL
ncbi:MAG: cell wall metabolism sensor histidine kinase WalK [Candidatus Margulisbacteria bacterium]|jgi:signal transduction histidine kinase|nr:cell wall metabolism sensor histidine kinase WalK [Candidatus Margulisiibacteriota bacterium]